MEVIDSNVFKTRIIIGELMNDFFEYIDNDRIVIIADAHVLCLYPKLFNDYPTIVIHTSEKTKTFDTVNYIYDKLNEYNVDKGSFILGVGGGVTTDLTGFAASTFLRGIPFGFMPTTLLAMTDAAIGGKNGINLLNYKNQVGTIAQPEYILVDTKFLLTLSEKEIYSGFAEIIKTAILWDSELYDCLHNTSEELLDLNYTEITNTIINTIKLKLDIVEKDQFDYGLRRLLNFGHTFGHAIEAEYGDSHYLSHGEAVAMGMIVSMKISISEKMIDKNLFDDFSNLLSRYCLPNKLFFDCKKILNKIKKDKKRENDVITFILLEGIARPIIKKYNINDMEYICNDIINF